MFCRLLRQNTFMQPEQPPSCIFQTLYTITSHMPSVTRILISCAIFLPLFLLLPCRMAAQQAAEYYQQAIEHRQRADFQEAYRLAVLADSLLQQEKTDSSSQQLAARIYYLQGIMLFNLGDYPQAVSLLQQADSCYLLLKDPGGRADCQLFWGNSLWYTEGAAAAVERFEKAVYWAERDSIGSRQYRGKYYLDKASALGELGEYEQAYLLIAHGLAIDSLTYGHHSNEYAQGLMVRAIVDNYAGDYYRSVSSLEAAMNIHLQMGSEAVDVKLAPIYGNLSFAYFNIHDLSESQRYARKALATYERVAGTHPYYFALIYVHLATICNNRGQFTQALDWYDKAEPLVTPDNRDLLLSLLFGRVVSLSGTGQYAASDSIARMTEPLVLAHYGTSHPNTATHYENFADNLMMLDSLQPCLQALQKAEAIYQAVYTAEHPINTYPINRRAQALFSLGQYRQALDEATLGLSFFEENQLYLQLEFRNPYKGLQLCRARSLRALATDADSLVRLREALQSYLALEAMEEQLMQEERNQDDRRYQQLSASQLYSEMMEVYGRLTRAGDDYFAAMWRLSEKNKSLSLLDGLLRSRLPGLEEMLDSIREVTIAYNYYQQKICDAQLANAPTDESQLLRWQSLAFDFEEQRRGYWKSILARNPRLARLIDPTAAIVDAAFVRDSLLGAGQAVLSYFVGDSSLFLFILTQDTSLIHIQTLDTALLRQQLQQLRFGLSGQLEAGYSQLSEEAVRQYASAACQLYELLIAPVNGILPTKVILIPDGMLGFIPFDVLLTSYPAALDNFKTYPYLLYNYQFSYAYSATLLRELRNHRLRPVAPRQFIALAPFFSESLRQLAQAYQDSEFPPATFPLLQHSGLEIASAAVYMQGDVITGEGATEEHFREIAGNYRIIHLATHGLVDNHSEDDTFLAFAPRKDSLENERLYLREIYQLPLSADLVILSACETGSGPLQRGEGIISLARAFTYAGAGSLFTSLWKIDNRATSYLMRNLYNELQQGKDKDEALRLARLRFLQEATVHLSYPYYWASFLPSGDMRPVR